MLKIVFNLSQVPLLLRVLFLGLIPATTIVSTCIFGWSFGNGIYEFTVAGQKLSRRLSSHYRTTCTNWGNLAVFCNIGLTCTFVLAWAPADDTPFRYFIAAGIFLLFLLILPDPLTCALFFFAASLRHCYNLRHHQYARFLSSTLLKDGPDGLPYTPLDYARAICINRTKLNHNLQRIRRAYDGIETCRLNCCLRLDDFADRRNPKPEETPAMVYHEILDELDEEFAAKRTHQETIAALEAENRDLGLTLDRDTATLNFFLLNFSDLSPLTVTDIITLCDPSYPASS